MANGDTTYLQTPLYVLLSQKDQNLEHVSRSATVGDAVTVMNTRMISSVLVMEDDELIGIFTERDVLARVVGAHLDPVDTPIVEVMTTDLVHIQPSATVQDALRVMNLASCRHLPVVDDDRLVGIISAGDLTRWMVHNQEQRIDDLVRYITGGYPD